MYPVSVLSVGKVAHLFLEPFEHFAEHQLYRRATHLNSVTEFLPSVASFPRNFPLLLRPNEAGFHSSTTPHETTCGCTEKSFSSQLWAKTQEWSCYRPKVLLWRVVQQILLRWLPFMQPNYISDKFTNCNNGTWLRPGWLLCIRPRLCPRVVQRPRTLIEYPAQLEGPSPKWPRPRSWVK